ncbi:hypothetical protein MSAN_01953000 [Mycena sanguinolenta]|uniref:Uncharacterized protein n=1 Tax=Mycena sanguinolenta TaxID=230812 RepID=A0A8H6XNA5_9AGAR|nr:hypothetical protein MSAN_01953000 [Mycena sanguinolenta]
MIRTQIERARRLRITFYGWQQGDSRPQVDMLQLLLEHSSVWEELRLELTTALVPTLRACRERLPVLWRAWVQWDGPESQVGIEAIDFFAMAHALADITVLCEYRFMPTLLPMHNQLIRYDFDAPWATHYELLKSLPNLREARITRNFDTVTPWPERREAILLLHLRRLYVNDPEILDHIRAPALEILAVLSDDDVETPSHLASFFMRSSCLLRRLCIAGLPDVESTMIILQQHPSITKLAFLIRDMHRKNQDTECDVFTRLIAHFTVSNATGMLPHISKLAFECQNADSVPWPLYLDMLDSRETAQDCTLQAAELLLPNAVAEPDGESLARMANLCQAGMQISFSSGENAEDRANQWLHMPFWE